MTKKKIKFKFSDEGSVDIQMEGFKGITCEREMNKIVHEDFLDGADIKKTKEYYEHEDNSDRGEREEEK